jgi:hypothetical protein
MTKLTVVNADVVEKLLKTKSVKVTNFATLGISNATKHIEAEVKLSIAGHRAEGPFIIHQQRKVTKGGKTRGPVVNDSVDTGNFLNSVQDRIQGLKGEVFSNSEYALALEYGIPTSTGKTVGRKHFTNSLARNKNNVTKILKLNIDKAIK